ncbi:PHB depolymerase family esterase [soil metagenome]
MKENVTATGRLTRHHLIVAGEKRSYWLYQPRARNSEQKLPLIIAMHGFLMPSRLMIEVCELNQLADQNHCQIVYPDMAFLWQFNLPRGFHNKDSQFIEQLIDSLIDSENVDASRVYATGYSNGADILHLFACSLALSSKIAAFAPVCSNLDRSWASAVEHGSPVAMMMISGTADPLNKWHGDLDRWMSVADTFEFWQGHNDIVSPNPGLHFSPTLASSESRTSAQLIQSFNAETGFEVSLLKIQGGGHTWPANRSDTWYSRAVLGPMHREHLASVEIWKFFERHHHASKQYRSAGMHITKHGSRQPVKVG